MAGYSHMLSNNAFGKVKSTHQYSGKQTFLGHSKYTNKSYAFNFINKDFENPNKVNAGALETRGQVYEGSIGAN